MANEEFTATDVDQGPDGVASLDGGGESAPQVEEVVADKMREIFSRNDARQQKDELEEEGLEGPDADAAEIEADAPEAEKVAEEGEEKTEETEETDPAVAARQETLEAFDPNLKRVAKELGGWSQKDLEDFIVSNPVLAKVTFSNMAAGYNRLSLQYAQGVRQPQLQQTQPQQQSVATKADQSALDSLLADPKKLKALEDVAGEELTKLFIKPLLDERKAMMEDRQYIGGLRRDALIREINDSFTGVSKDGFEDYYGKDGDVSQEQTSNRFKVGQLADQIRAGAQMQGLQMGVNEAIKRAHLIVTADQVKAQARKEVVKQVTKRATQLTSRPTARHTRQLTPRTEAAALAAVEDFWDQRA